MGRTVSIRFKDGKVSKVSGARTPAERESAAAWGQAFVDIVHAPKKGATPSDARANLLARVRAAGARGESCLFWEHEADNASALVDAGLASFVAGSPLTLALPTS